MNSPNIIVIRYVKRMIELHRYATRTIRGWIYLFSPSEMICGISYPPSPYNLTIYPPFLSFF